ncbi:Alpha/Beta hydrolase protein [Mycena leptocephala]|nr:Alpha/Beta hydrolase protein [Mycena leptocephala]
MRVSLTILSAVYASVSFATPVLVNTSSGLLQGSRPMEVSCPAVVSNHYPFTSVVSSFKGIRFAQPATGALRWEPPVPFISTKPQNVTTLGPSCLQQFAFASSALDQFLLTLREGCSRLHRKMRNVWAPASKNQKLPVLVWIYGGGLSFGTASLPAYDGTSIAANQRIILVTFNYRTNVFGFPGSPDLPLAGNNLGFLDQELAFLWVQTNIARFGGDPNQVTIMGQSAGSQSVSSAIARHTPNDAPFRAGIMLSGAQVSMSPIPSFTSFNNFSAAVGCTQTPGPARLACLKRVPAAVIRNFTNGPTSGSFAPVVDVFSDPLERIRTGLTARSSIMIGNTQNDGTAFLCPAELWSGAAVGAGITNVFRYTYGAVFADLQLFPGAGAWHSSELPEIFGTFNPPTATAPEVTLSQTMQTIVANFVKNPAVSPAPNWSKYVPGNATTTLAKLAYNGNVVANNVVQAVESDSIDGPCNALWNLFLDIRE